MIEVDLPDGSVAEFPDGTQPDTIKAALRKRFAPPAPVAADGRGDRPVSWGETASDVAKSAGVGLAKGAIGLAGAVGDVQQLMGKAGGKVAGWLGASPETVQAVEAGSRKMIPLIPYDMPTSAGIQDKVEGVTGEFYHPKTTAGQYAETIGEFAPATMAGPGSLARRAALTVAPAMASEAAGQATEGTAAEPYARVAAALVAGAPIAGRTNRGVRQSAFKDAAKGAPTQDAIKQQTNALYKQLRTAGIKYDSNAFGRLATDLEGTLKQGGFLSGTNSKVEGLFNNIRANVGKSPDFADVESWRQAAGNLARSVDGADRAAGNIIREAIDTFYRVSPYMSTGTAGPQAQQLVKQARELALRKIKLDKIDDIKNAAPDYLSGYESGLRNMTKNTLRSKQGKSLFKPGSAEREALSDVVHGGPGRKVAQTIGRFGLDVSRKGNIAAMLPGGANLIPFTMMDPVTAALVSTAGLGVSSASKVAARKATEAALERASAMIRSGSSAQKKAIARALLEQGRRDVRRTLLLEPALRSPLAASPVPQPVDR